MESVQSILSTILKHVETLPSEDAPLLQALGCIAGADLIAAASFPPATISLVQGFAIRQEWLAGASSQKPIKLPILSKIQYENGKDEPAAIPVGLFERLPDGFDAVLSSEEFLPENNFLLSDRPPEIGENILSVGSRIRKGEVFLSKGSEITYSDIGTASFLGMTSLPVVRKPKIALVFVCSSLKRVQESEIFHQYLGGVANTIAAQALKYLGVIKNYKILSDFSRSDQMAISRAFKSDLILFIGECSKRNQIQLIRNLEKRGVQFHLQTKNILPGLFFSFGTFGEKLVFLLPGDPKGAVLNFEEFIRPVIFKMRGKKQIHHDEVNARLGKSLRNSEGKISLIQAFVQLKNGVFHALPLENGRRGGLNKLHTMNGIIVLPENIKQVPTGTVLRVQMLRQPDWSY